MANSAAFSIPPHLQRYLYPAFGVGIFTSACVSMATQTSQYSVYAMLISTVGVAFLIWGYDHLPAMRWIAPPQPSKQAYRKRAMVSQEVIA